MVIIREALISDNKDLLYLTSLTPMKGRISLRIDRNPDFFSLLNMRGRSKVFVAEKNGIFAGCFSVSDIEILVNGKHEIVHYLADLKIHPAYGGIILGRLLKKMSDFLTQNHADLIFCTAAFGNDKVMSLFEGRAGFPKFNFAGIFKVYQIIPLNRKINNGNYTIREAELNDDIVGLYNKFYLRYKVAPLYSRANLNGTRTLAAFDKNILIASITLSDISPSKQNVLIDLPFTLRFAISLLRVMNRILPVINLPEIGKPVRVLYIKAFAFKKGYDNALPPLIQTARKIAFIEKYCYLTVGIHEKDPLSRIFSKNMHFTFRSLGYILSLAGNNNKINEILNGVLFEDYSLV